MLCCRLSFCDLAGSERHSKTQTVGDRIKEAGNINTSLLTLGRCIKTLRHNQLNKLVIAVPTLIINFNNSVNDRSVVNRTKKI